MTKKPMTPKRLAELRAMLVYLHPDLHDKMMEVLDEIERCWAEIEELKLSAKLVEKARRVVEAIETRRPFDIEEWAEQLAEDASKFNDYVR